MSESARHAAVARNLDALLAAHALGRNELADRIGVPAKWVRAVVSGGVSRTERRNADYLRSVAEFFGLPTPEVLWQPDLIHFRVNTNGTLLPPAPADTDRSQTFACNLDRLLASKGLSRKDAAADLGVDYKWLRRAVSSGLDRIERRNQSALDAIVRHFRLSSVNDLWHPNLVAVEVRPKDVVTPPRSARPRRPLLFQWPGHKHRQAARIVSLLPDEIATYHEPFLGGGGVLLQLLQSDVKVKRCVVGDHYAPLVEMWKAVKVAPAMLMTEYRRLWRLLADTGRTAYDEVRRAFNRDHDPLKLFFLLRVTRDGRFVFRRDGRLYCRLRDGMHQNRQPEATERTVRYWSDKLQAVELVHRDFSSVKTRPGDVIYADPPYRAVYEPRYVGTFGYERFFGWVARQRGSVFVSLDRAGATAPDVPQELFSARHVIPSGADTMTGRPAIADNLLVRPSPRYAG
jgi:DNA adenine methylase